jgi:hypothetical protein
LLLRRLTRPLRRPLVVRPMVLVLVLVVVRRRRPARHV